MQENLLDNARLMIVDDNMTNLRFYAAIFRDPTIKRILVYNGQEAIDHLEHNDVDIIIMDLQMPKLDGFDAIKHIRSNLKLNIPIIAISAHESLESKERAIALGANDFIQKPIDAIELRNMVAYWYRQSKGEIKLQNQKLRILFVDDELDVLKSLRRSLYHQRDVWDMEFSDSAQQALAELARKKYDVLVTDLRMPIMGGIELLVAVKESYPTMICFVLSGFSDNENILKTLGLTDLFLVKPCNTLKLKAEIENAMHKKRTMQNVDLSANVEIIRALPTAPKIYYELTSAINSQNAAEGDILRIISKDVVLAVRIVKLLDLVKQIKRGRENGIKDIRTFLGTHTMQAVTLLSGLLQKIDDDVKIKYNISRICTNNVFVGLLASHITKKMFNDMSLEDTICMAAILKDVGKIIMRCNSFSEHMDIRFNDNGQVREVDESEPCDNLLKNNEICDYLMSVWGVPETVIIAIDNFHNYHKKASKIFTASTGLFIANMIFEEENSIVEKSIKTKCKDYSIASETIQEWIRTGIELKEISLQSTIF